MHYGCLVLECVMWYRSGVIFTWKWRLFRLTDKNLQSFLCRWALCVGFDFRCCSTSLSLALAFSSPKVNERFQFAMSFISLWVKTELAFKPPPRLRLLQTHFHWLLFLLLSLKTFYGGSSFQLFFIVLGRCCDTEFSTKIKQCAFAFNTFLIEWEWITTNSCFDDNRSTKHWRRLRKCHNGSNFFFSGAIDDDVCTRNTIDIDFLGPFNWCYSLFKRHLLGQLVLLFPIAIWMSL